MLKMTFNFNGVTVTDGVLNVIMPSISTDQTTLSFGLAYRASTSDPLLNSETYSCPYDITAGDPFSRHSAPDLGINLPIALTQYLQNDLLVSC